jgi:hypothetical protein
MKDQARLRLCPAFAPGHFLPSPEAARFPLREAPAARLFAVNSSLSVEQFSLTKTETGP